MTCHLLEGLVQHLTAASTVTLQDLLDIHVEFADHDTVLRTAEELLKPSARQSWSRPSSQFDKVRTTTPWT